MAGETVFARDCGEITVSWRFSDGAPAARQRWDIEPHTYRDRMRDADAGVFFKAQFPGYDYMAYLRHHGFPSPLLDWTRSPYVAAFFAFRDLGGVNWASRDLRVSGDSRSRQSRHGRSAVRRRARALRPNSSPALFTAVPVHRVHDV